MAILLDQHGKPISSDPDENRLINAKFDAAQTTADNRNHWSAADGLSARAAATPAVRKTVRDRSRYEAGSNSWYSGLLRTATNHVVGTGPRLQVLGTDRAVSARVEAAWSRWAKAARLVEMVRVAFESYWRDGEVFFLRWSRLANQPVQLDVRLAEADQVFAPWGYDSLDSSVEDGVRTDPTGRGVEYYVARQHPGDRVAFRGPIGDWWPASDVIHLFRADRPGQVRGLPRLMPALPLFAVLRRHTLATLFAAEAAARHAIVMQTAAGAGAPKRSPQDFAEVELPSNAMTILPEGWQIGQVKPEHPTTNHEMFQRQTLMEIARCSGMPYSLVCGSSKDSNFSSAKMDVRNTWGPEVVAEQERLNRTVCDVVFRWFLDEAVFAPGLLDGLPPLEQVDYQWQWDPLPTTDEIDDVNAADARLKAGLSTLPLEYQRRGLDFDSAMTRGAQSFGVTVDQYKQAVFQSLFGQSPAAIPAALPAPVSVPVPAQAAAPAAGGEFGGLSRRQLTNNVKAVRDVLKQLIAGDITRVMAEQLLQTLGLTPERADVLISDAVDGAIDDPEMAARGALTVEAAAKSSDLRMIGSCELAAAGGGQRRFRILAYAGGTLRLGNFDQPVVVDLAGLSIPADVPILIDHTKSVEATLGLATTCENDGRQLVLSGVVTGVSPKAQQVLAMADAGHRWQASIGASATDVEEVPAGQSVVVNGQRFDGPIIVARRSELRETSVLPMGADASTVVNLAASAAGVSSGASTMPTFEEWLASLKIDAATLSEEAKAALMQAYELASKESAPTGAQANTAADQNAAVPTDAAASLNVQASVKTEIALARKAAADELRRQADIRAKCEGHPTIAAKAIEAGWTIDKAELEVMKARGTQAHHAASNGFARSRTTDSQVIEAALCLTAAMPNVEKQFKPETLEIAHREYRNLGLQQLIIMAAAANGWICRPGERLHRGNLEDALHYAFPRREIRAAGFSTVSLPGILSNVANKEILIGYEEQDQTWQEIAAVKSVPDFKTVTSYRMLDDMEYLQVGKGGEIKHGTIGEESFTRSAKTYARMFTLTREDIINDDLAAFDDIRNRLGAGAAKKLNNVFWSAFLDNSAFFTSGRGNYITGSTTNLGTDGVGLGLGVKAFRQLRTPTADGQKRVGNVVGGQPEILLHPPELEQIADQTYQNTNLGGGTTVANANIYAKKYRPVVCPWLSDSNFTGYSATAWYLLRNPSVMPAMVVSFLNGQRTPTVESSETDFDKLGIQFRGYHDFGCDQAEYLCGIKSKGAA